VSGPRVYPTSRIGEAVATWLRYGPNMPSAEGTLDWRPLRDSLELVASVVAAQAEVVPDAMVAPIDPALADTAAFCGAYDVPPESSANCVVVVGRRGGETRYAAVVVLATMRADVNGVIRKQLDVRKCSFAPIAEAVALTRMEYGGITPVGLPAGWPVFVDESVAASGDVVIGSGARGSKLLVAAGDLVKLPGGRLLNLAG
jgi:prolyl-tRNA editing enzyme YbaK/EbsC (Cys-tRNA(Pro) deacylase)